MSDGEPSGIISKINEQQFWIMIDIMGCLSKIRKILNANGTTKSQSKKQKKI